MKKFRMQCGVEMSDGETLTVVADQRDWARMEVEEFPRTAIATRVRFLAWSAMTRQQLTKLTWDKFNLSECLDAQDVTPDEEDEGEQGNPPS